jgi:polysaccharide deacetylase family protein (PEP-CTERM system associated)
VRRAKRILEDLSGKRVVGYRAPSFSITEETDWALRILVEEGHLYDSSVYHKFRERYGKGQSVGRSYQIQTGAGSLWEVPPSTMKACGVHIPVAGGGYFRLMPYPIVKMFLKHLERNGVQLVMYFHPWEIDPHQPRMQGPLLSRVRHYMNLDKTELRLGNLLADFAFGPIAQVLEPLRGCKGEEKQLNGKSAFPYSKEWIDVDADHDERQQVKASPLI